MPTRNYALTVSAEFDRYLAAAGSFALFVGAGPYWARGRNFTEYVYSSVDPPGIAYGDRRSQESRTWELGGFATTGFEWFVRPRLSVLGRVGASFGFGERHQYDREASWRGAEGVSRTSQFDSSTASAGTSTAALGLSAYF
jgi:hypothetical protein